jgi:MinD-like ATPase involved in chromosome partitioning or flagellar assembly
MIPTDVRLFTWIDVEEVFLRLREDEQWPDWLMNVKAYWDGLNLQTTAARETVIAALIQWFDPRFQKVDTDSELLGNVLLESADASKQRTLPVFFDLVEATETAPKVFVPSWGRPVNVSSLGSFGAPSILAEANPPIIAFHSFKGGVGRTMLSIGLAKSCAEAGFNVLLIDADFEAPGISWLIKSRISQVPISMADFLALLHGDSEQEIVMGLTVERVRNAFLDGCYIMPAFRTMDRFSTLEVRPEHIIQSADDPYLLTAAIGELGRQLSVDLVIVDLRAGMSELAAGLILDPRIYRVLVSTMGGQSIEGTLQILESIRRLAPSSRESDPIPAVVLSQIPRRDNYEALIAENVHRLGLSLQQCAKHSTGLEAVPVFTTNFDPDLAALPADWEMVLKTIGTSGLGEAIRGLTEWLPDLAPVPEAGQAQVQADMNSRRRKFAEWARRLIYAETSQEHILFVNEPLRRLLSENRTQVPVCVVVGAKGAGKTYTFLQITNKRTWANFASIITASGYTDALVCPILEPINLDGGLVEELSAVRQEVAAQVKFGTAASSSDVRDEIRNLLKRELNESEWRESWLDLIARTVGFTQGPQCGRGLVKHLQNTQRKLIVVFDGLEDIFQNVVTEERQKIAMRSLLQDLPDWLSQQPGRPLGLLLFVREDMVLEAVKQNAPQLMHKYDAYALRWTWEEALRLVVWMCAQSGLMFRSEDVYNMTNDSVKDNLATFWGRKLGSDKSREARSAEWVLGALSGPRGLIQARDIVRLVAYSAAKSVDDAKWTDRVLIPSAIRDSLSECSKEKVAEIIQENPVLKPLFERMRELPKESRYTPFEASEIKLGAEELKLLERNGVIVRDGDRYELPEIFRYGLLFERKGGARPRVLRHLGSV